MDRNQPTDSTNPLQFYSGKYAPLADDFVRVQPLKRQRHSTGSTGGESSQGHTNNAAFTESFSKENLKDMSSDEKLKCILEGPVHLNVWHYRVNNIEPYFYSNSATNEVMDERVKLLEYKSLDSEARQKQTLYCQESLN